MLKLTSHYISKKHVHAFEITAVENLSDSKFIRVKDHLGEEQGVHLFLDEASGDEVLTGFIEVDGTHAKFQGKLIVGHMLVIYHNPACLYSATCPKNIFDAGHVLKEGLPVAEEHY